MSISKKVPYFEAHETENGLRIFFNAPSEILKRIGAVSARFSNKDIVDRRKQILTPDVIVVGDTILYQGMELCVPEFVFLFNIFLAGNYSFPQMKVERKIYLIGEEDRIKSILRDFEITMYGYTNEEMKKAGQKNSQIRKMLLDEGADFAPKLKIGESVIPVPVDEFVTLVPFKGFSKNSGTAEIKELNLTVTHTGQDSYTVCSNSVQTEVVLNSDGDMGPSWEIPKINNVETPHDFRIINLGADSGFGPFATTTNMVETAGRFLLIDHHAYTQYILKANGWRAGDIDAVILTHVHNDHFCNLRELAINGQKKVKLISTPEILAMVKEILSLRWKESQEKIEMYFDWQEVYPGTPFKVNGAVYRIHYGVHSIPSIGVSVSFNDKHQATFTGDTALESVLRPKLERGVITKQRFDEIQKLLDQKEGVIIADIGEASIHGAPVDLSNGNHRRLMTAHRNTRGLIPNNQDLMNLVKTGQQFCVGEPITDQVKVSLISNVLDQLDVIEKNKWTMILSNMSVCEYHEAEKIIVQRGSKELDYVYLILHGLAEVKLDGKTVASLGRGSYFGEQAFIGKKQPRNATVASATSMILVGIPGKDFAQMIEEDHQLAKKLGKEVSSKNILQNLWQSRMIFSQVRELANIPTNLQHELARTLKVRQFAPGDKIILKGSQTDEAYAVVKGQVMIKIDKPGTANPVKKEGELFGELVSAGVQKERSADAEAVTAVEVIVIPGATMKALRQNVPAVAHAIANNVEKYQSTQTAGDEKVVAA